MDNTVKIIVPSGYIPSNIEDDISKLKEIPIICVKKDSHASSIKQLFIENSYRRFKS